MFNKAEGASGQRVKHAGNEAAHTDTRGEGGKCANDSQEQAALSQRIASFKNRTVARASAAQQKGALYPRFSNRESDCLTNHETPHEFGRTP